MSEEYNIVYKLINDLEFDRENPRLPHSVVNSTQEKDVIDWMLKDASIIELMGSIGEKGFFPAEPLLVVKKSDSNKYTVVEGNRRLTAVKLLNQPNLTTKRIQSINAIVDEAVIIPSELPVMVFPERKQILDYLGFKHITGVKQWSALAKAKYLKELQREYSMANLSINDQYKKLAKAIGSRADYVRDLLIGLDVYNNIHQKSYFNIDGLDEDSIEFGVYYNALKFSNIPKYLGIDMNSENPTKKINQASLEALTKIISEKLENNKTKLGESRNLTILNSIILEPRPLQMLTSGKKSIQEAALYLEGPHEIFKTSLVRSKSLLQEAQSALKEITQCNQSDVKLVAEVMENLVEIESSVNSKIDVRKKRKA